MSDCKHPELEFLGNQKTDDGQNTYMKCKVCGDLVVVMPGNRGFSVNGVASSRTS